MKRVVISQDIRPLHHALQSGLRAHHVGENWLRPKERSEVEKRADALKREIDAMKSAQPGQAATFDILAAALRTEKPAWDSGGPSGPILGGLQCESLKGRFRPIADLGSASSQRMRRRYSIAYRGRFMVKTQPVPGKSRTVNSPPLDSTLRLAIDSLNPTPDLSSLR